MLEDIRCIPDSPEPVFAFDQQKFKDEQFIVRIRSRTYYCPTKIMCVYKEKEDLIGYSLALPWNIICLRTLMGVMPRSPPCSFLSKEGMLLSHKEGSGQVDHRKSAKFCRDLVKSRKNRSRIRNK